MSKEIDKRSRIHGLRPKVAAAAAKLEPYFTSKQLAAQLGDVATLEQVTKMCSLWASKGFLSVVGSARLTEGRAPAFIYAKTKDFQKLLSQKSLFEMPPLGEPESGKVIPLRSPKRDLKPVLGELIAALDMLRDAAAKVRGAFLEEDPGE